MLYQSPGAEILSQVRPLISQDITILFSEFMASGLKIMKTNWNEIQIKSDSGIMKYVCVSICI